MTEWTPEEDAVAKVIYDELEGPINDQDFGRQMRQWELSRKIARAAIAAMQPRWRDVRTDPPPLGKPVITCRAGENGVNMSALLYDGEWVEQGSGRTTVTHHSFAAPTHWQPPPIPTAPEDRT